MGTITIKDIARIADVGIATVSRALNNTGTVNEETKKKILNIAKEYHYIPNSNARNLKVTQTQNIALLVKGISNPFFADMIKEIQRQVNLRRYSLIIQQIDDDTNELDVALELILEKKICGIIFMGGTYNHPEQEVIRLNIPCVLTTITLAGNQNSQYFSSVVIDEVNEAKKATEYLISLGHRQIAFLAKSPFVPNTTGNMRLKGYKEAMETVGLEFDTSFVEDCEYTPSSGYSAMNRLLNKNKELTAVFAGADTIAIGCAKAALNSGRCIPDDISIIGFDGIEMAEYFNPSLDTISQPGIAMALSSINILFDLINGSTENQHLLYQAVLLKRGSCGPKKN